MRRNYLLQQTRLATQYSIAHVPASSCTLLPQTHNHRKQDCCSYYTQTTQPYVFLFVAKAENYVLCRKKYIRHNSCYIRHCFSYIRCGFCCLAYYLQNTPRHGYCNNTAIIFQAFRNTCITRMCIKKPHRKQAWLFILIHTCAFLSVHGYGIFVFGVPAPGIHFTSFFLPSII